MTSKLRNTMIETIRESLKSQRAQAAAINEVNTAAEYGLACYDSVIGETTDKIAAFLAFAIKRGQLWEVSI